jgi:hypothetical protein
VTAVGQRLYYSAGKPLFFVADTAWRLCERLNLSDIIRYLDVRKAQGFNSVIVGTDGAWWSSPDVPRMALWGKLDAVFDAAQERGMYIIPTIQLQEYVDGRPVLRLPAGCAGNIGLWTAIRYCNASNLLFWMVGGLDEKGTFSTGTIVDLARGIRMGDPYHLITYHPASRHTSVVGIPIGPNHEVALYQSYQELSYNVITPILQGLAATGLPFANIEPVYEGTYGGASGSPDDVDRVAATCAKQRVCGMAYGHHDVWSFSAKWQTALNAPGVGKFIARTKEAVRP